MSLALTQQMAAWMEISSSGLRRSCRLLQFCPVSLGPLLSVASPSFGGRENALLFQRGGGGVSGRESEGVHVVLNETEAWPLKYEIALSCIILQQKNSNQTLIESGL